MVSLTVLGLSGKKSIRACEAFLAPERKMSPRLKAKGCSTGGRDIRRN